MPVKQEITVNEHDDAKLDCVANGRPTPEYHWNYKGIALSGKFLSQLLIKNKLNVETKLKMLRTISSRTMKKCPMDFSSKKLREITAVNICVRLCKRREKLII